ncbi:MAG: T9SS C-terminal target domain-containing protein [Bacteroidetes bacterium]|nr:MAG: T9SS C-terminal target domain-containing protein [Bacteroidota bacterium]
MKKIFTILSVSLLFAALFVGFSTRAAAQNVEGEPIMLFTTHFLPPGTVIPVTMKEASNSPVIVATPNPVSGGIVKVWYKQINGTADLNIYDVSGKVRYSTQVGSAKDSQGLIELNVSDFAAGIYIVKLSAGAQTAIQKIIVR